MSRFINNLKRPHLTRVEIGCILGVILGIASLALTADTRTTLAKVKLVVCGQRVDRLTERQARDLRALCTSAIPGPTGSTGPTGAAGAVKAAPAAKPGRNGHDGSTGAAGTAGVNGTNGAQGPPGGPGPPGPRGAAGKQGPPGEKGAKGDPGASVDTQAIVAQVVAIVEQDLPAIVRQTVCSLTHLC